MPILTRRRKPAVRGVTPVFFDTGGRRWRRIVIGTTLALLGGLAIVIPLSMSALQPLWPVPEHGGSGYPAQLLATNHGAVPVIGGEDTGAVLVRVDAVQHRGGVTYLTDPYSGKVIRAATADEAAAIGTHPIVVDWYGYPAAHQLLLTFDDGPDPQNTPQILDILGRAHVPATFFVIGQNVARYPSILGREVREGHVVGNHTLMHQDAGHGALLDRAGLIANDRIIRAAARYGTRLFRIPNANPDGNVLTILQAQQLGYTVVNLDLDTSDWQYRPGRTVPLPKLDGRGHVVLLHDGGANHAATIALVPKLIAEAKAKGYTFTTVQALVPPQDKPQRVTASAADRYTLYSAWGLLVLPGTVMTWLFRFAVGSVVVVSLTYLVLAVINWFRQRHRVWPPLADPPMVTVVVPAYKEEKVLAKTLGSLVHTDYPNFEVIAVDDGSDDDTWGVMSAFASVWPRLRAFRLDKNSGKAAAMNFALAQARGEIIITVDGDTVFEPQSVAALARHFADPRVGAVAGQVKVGNRKNLLTAWQSLEYTAGIGLNRMAEDLVNAISIAPGACAAWRKSAVQEADGFPWEILADDAGLTLKLRHLGYKVELDNDAISWTEAPMTARTLARQRVRWAFALLQAYRKHRRMMFNPRYGALGMVALPYSLVSILVPLLFMPLTYIFLGLVLASGHWQPVALFAGFVLGVQLITAAVGIAMVRESWWHLLVVPVYRLIYEPLRAYVLYKAILLAIKGKAVGWARIARTGTV